MLKPVCVPCQRFFRMKKGGFYFTEGMPIGSDVAPGTAEPEKWVPYKVWAGDLWKCQGCGAEILSGFGHNPIATQHEDKFGDLRMMLGADRYQVNDC